ncbi:WYL domain-containing protein [Kitasatospora sp. NA04385]|uniref:helix-turn-helix transcriptional regulator n=1 Tax=Kitasatospora sp. NA04385 TaxID=2742135 RepID=UPI0015915570|nr:WYL domain-containing protein [Kitasatospora sp. NA04385]QKW22866.1 WYL domain-containing protein [Kitasatospora sp. NA04385]
MNRTARLYALVEELRAVAPRPLTVARLAARFEVATRTVQRDLQALMAAGLPVRSTTGRGGGWSIDPRTTLPPVRFTAQEAAALTVALAATDPGAPYAAAARTAAQKLTAVLPAPAADAARDLARRIVALPAPGPAAEIRTAVERALAEGTVLRLRYADAAGRPSERLVEPAGLLTAGGHWYLIAWCRTRRAGRGFRLDRITAADPTAEPARPHDLAALLRGSAAAGARPPAALGPL